MLQVICMKWGEKSLQPLEGNVPLSFLLGEVPEKSKTD